MGRVIKSGDTFRELIDNINSGTLDTVTGALDIQNAISVFVSIKEASGDLDAAVFTLQYSPNDVDWADTTHSITFAAETYLSKNNLPVTARFVRVKTTTKSTIASTADIIIQAK